MTCVPGPLGPEVELLQGPSGDSWGLFSQFSCHCIWGLLSERDLSLGTSTVGSAEEWGRTLANVRDPLCLEQGRAPQAAPSPLFQLRST